MFGFKGPAVLIKTQQFMNVNSHRLGVIDSGLSANNKRPDRGRVDIEVI